MFKISVPFMRMTFIASLLLAIITSYSCRKSNIDSTINLNGVNTSLVTASTGVTTTLEALRKTQVKSGITYIITDYGGGSWVYDSADTKSSDNTGTVIVTSYNQRVKRLFQGALNVQWFGAKGDSTTDATAAINLTLATAHQLNLSVYIPKGVYLCDQIDASNHILVFNSGSNSNIRLYGDGLSSRITCHVSANLTLLYLYAYSGAKNIVMDSLYFESRHSPGMALVQGIFIQGTKGQNFLNTSLIHSKMEGFSTDLSAQGVNNLTISNNDFEAPKGHDEAPNNTNPAVFLWFHDNANGYCSNVNIVSNYANGYSGMASISTLISKRPMDGFIYGTGYGFLITGNNTKNFSEEHIALAPTSTFPNANKQITILGNVLDGNIPAGSLNANGSLHTGNYAIRCDAGYATIKGNTVYNFTTGIMVRTFDYPMIQKGNYFISGNNLYSASSQNGLLINAGITVQGSLAKRLHQIVIENNLVSVSGSKTQNGFSAILVYDTDTALVQNNTIQVSGLSSLSGQPSYGRTYGRVSKISDLSNTATGITAHNTIASTDQVTF